MPSVQSDGIVETDNGQYKVRLKMTSEQREQAPPELQSLDGQRCAFDFKRLNVCGTKPDIGDQGCFEVEVQGGGTPTIARVVSWINPRANNRFVHPYNFVRFPSNLNDAVKRIPLFSRSIPAPHDRQLNNCARTGYIDCIITMHADWFIPHPDKLSINGEHDTLGYYTLDLVNHSEWKKNPGADATRPAIPGSSLRGMIRNIYEVATLSCLGVFDSGRLDFRIGFGPDANEIRKNVDYVPCRVIEKLDDGGVAVQFLDGRFPADPERQKLRDSTPITLPVALIQAYDGRVLGNGVVGKPSAQWRPLDPNPSTGDPGVRSGTPVAMLLNVQARRHRSNRYCYREATCIVPIKESADHDQFKYPTPAAKQQLAFGYLQRTGPNIEGKHFERIFFNAAAPYNDPKSPLSDSERLNGFLADTSPQHAVHERVVRIAMDALKKYADRLGKRVRELNKELKPPRPLSESPNPPYVSDFVCETADEVEIRCGDLFYALVRGNSRTDECTIEGLYPVAIPRLTHPETRGDLLPSDVFPCSRCSQCSAQGRATCDECFERHAHLCPACRLFGWVRDMSHARGMVEGDDQRVDSWAGHIRFSHAHLMPANATLAVKKIILPVLGSPKPTFTEFYLRPFSNWRDGQAQRWPPAIRKHESPIYSSSEANLRGRKFYRRRAKTRADQPYPGDGGLMLSGAGESSQNHTIYALPSGMNFAFRVQFDNMSDVELGALVFALTLSKPRSWPEASGPFRHQIGHGKPLGMGSCEIMIQRFYIEQTDGDRTNHIYQRAPDFSPLPKIVFPASLAERQTADANVQRLSEYFEESWRSALALQPDLSETLTDLLDILCPLPGDVPIHYPPRWAWPLPQRDEFIDAYTWFVAYRRGKRADKRTDCPARLPISGSGLPNPADERSHPDQRLPVDATQPDTRR